MLILISPRLKTFTSFGTDGVPISKFLDEYGPFTVVLNYDGAKYERSFSREEVLLQVSILEKTAILQTVPHVVRKPTAPKVALPSFRLQATPIPPKQTVDVPTGSLPSKE